MARRLSKEELEIGASLVANVVRDAMTTRDVRGQDDVNRRVVASVNAYHKGLAELRRQREDDVRVLPTLPGIG